MATELIFMKEFNLYECESKVLEVTEENDKYVVFLDQTVFYPQGGGQPFDKGTIESKNAKFIVDEVRFVDGIVKHIGRFEFGELNKNDIVKCSVDKIRRDLNSKLHSAGHVIDLAIKKLNLNWIPGKGYHFPEGPYVEYSGIFNELDKEKLKSDIEEECNELIKKGQETKLVFLNKDEARKYCDYIPENLPQDKPLRLVMYGNVAIFCGGTHVKNISEIKGMKIRKLKVEKNNLRVSYNII